MMNIYLDGSNTQQTKEAIKREIMKLELPIKNMVDKLEYTISICIKKFENEPSVAITDSVSSILIAYVVYLTIYNQLKQSNLTYIENDFILDQYKKKNI